MATFMFLTNEYLDSTPTAFVNNKFTADEANTRISEKYFDIALS